MKEQEDIALFHQRKRRKHKIKLAIESFITILIGIILLFIYTTKGKDEYINYKEKADVNYKINLKENEFYPESYVKEESAVATLIKDIDANFNYKLNSEQEQEYVYSYKILANIDVLETVNSTSIYKIDEELFNSGKQESHAKNLVIDRDINIDYTVYNEKINKFISVYNLNNVKSTLSINMELDVINKNDGKRINKERKVMSLDIPLTTKTVNIELGKNVVDGEGQLLIKENKTHRENLKYLLVIGILLLAIGIIILIRLIQYIIKRRSAELMYKQELNSIMFNYKSYIQQINDDTNLKDYKQLQINTFKEILEMRETVQSPILMYTEEKDERTKFMIINNDMLFVFVLGVTEIRNRLREESKKAK